MDSRDNRQHRIRHQQVVPSYSGAVAPIYSGVDCRGQLFATNNFLNMTGVLLGVGAAYGLQEIVGIGPAGVFVAIGVAALALAVASFSSRCVLLLAHPGLLMDEQTLPSGGQK